MAWLRDITRKCSTCDRAATVELTNKRNDPVAPYCKGCGRKALERLQRTEDAEPPREYR